MNILDESRQAREANFNINRRDFAKMALGGAALLASADRISAKTFPIPPGIKIGTYARNPTEENMLYLRQLGVTWVSSGDIVPESATVEGFTRMREQWEAGGFKVYNESGRVAPSGDAIINVPEIVLNLPGRDAKIEEYLDYLRYLGKADIHYMTYGFEGDGNWRSGTATSRRGYIASDCDLSSPTFHGGWNGTIYKEPLSHGRVFSREEVWDNFTYFIKKVVPVAEESGVRIGIHPDDPPQPMLAGVPAFSPALRATSEPWKLRTVPTWAFVCAWEPGSRADRKWARTRLRSSNTSAPRRNCSKFISATFRLPCPTSQRP